MSDVLIFGLAVLFSSVISGMTGMGGGVVLLAFMSPIFPPMILIPLHGTIQLLSNVTRVSFSLKQVNLKVFLMFSIGTVIGSLAGTPLPITLSEKSFTIVLTLAILILTWLPKITRAFNFKGKFIVIGAVASFLSLFIGATGPLTSPFFLNSGIEKESFVPTKAACQIPIHLFKLIIYLWSGFIISEWFPEIMISIPFILAGTFIGKVLVSKMNSQFYILSVKIIITVLVARMLIMAFLD